MRQVAGLNKGKTFVRPLSASSVEPKLNGEFFKLDVVK